ncbi:ATP-dependent bile acid permease [Diplodia seriata]|uniref:ATP-dependent bile acid permease n=1 Tax=Diplodia seriata TaxID=420778 RepID=A0A1S8BNJ1_9PEZI|nr:ATP-dependent bile acid permease [Diplodia seriata]
MFARCDSPVWRGDDFTECFEQDYLQTLLPLIICGLSLLYLSLQLYRAWQQSKYYTAYHSLDSWRNVWSFRPVQHSLGTNSFQQDSDSDTEDELERNAGLALVPTRTNDSFVELDRPKGEVLLVVVEELAVLGELAIHVAALVEGKGTLVSRISGVAVWAYVATLASARLLVSNTNRLSLPRLWFHTASIYCFLWLFEILLFRSAIIHPKSLLAQNLTIADFALTTLLAVIALTSRKGNRPVELEYEGHINPSKEQTASVLSLATFGWVDGIVWQGYKKTFEMADVWNLAPKDKANAIIAQYRQFKKTQALSWHLLRYFRSELLIQGVWAACSGFFLFVPTILLKLILEYVEDPSSTPRNAAWFFVILLFLSGVTSALADGQALWIGRKICIRLRAIIIGEIYAKALKRRAASSGDKVLGEKKPEWSETKRDRFKRVMSFRRKKARPEASKITNSAVTNTADTQVSSGAIINLMAVDSFKVAEISAYLHFLWASTPVQVVVSVVLLYRILGLSSVAGIGMMIFLLPINMLISKRFAAIQKQILAATDVRIHTTNEILTNIRIIKYFAWEQRFMAQVSEKRTAELANLRRRYQWWAAAATVWSGAPIIITFLSFFFYTIIEKKDLVPSVAFTALSLFQLLRIPLDQLADMVAHVQESKVSVDRIEEYLNEPETDKYKQLKSEEFDENDEPLIGFDHGTFSWGNGESEDGGLDDAFKMLDMDVRFPVGQLSVIVGSTGCGKTSLLMALLGEMTLIQGKVYLPGGRCREDLSPDPDTGLTESVAYCAQQAWLMNGTIKDNIIFNSPFDPRRYKDVIVACSLQRDLEILDGGDQTLVGEKGVTLSGGQKQRISLARALYSKARHVLLDDVLSAVDSHTAKWIFDQALLGPLMYNRTCILVTHNVQLCLPHSEFAVLLDNGRIAVQGTPNELIDSGRLSEDLSKSRPVSRAPSRVASRVPSDVGGEEAIGENGHANGSANGHVGGAKDGKQAESQEETKAVGGVKIGIILMYLKSMGRWWYWVAAFAAFAAQQLASVGTNIWIRQWANAYNNKQVSIFGAQKQTSHVTHTNVVTGLGSCLTSGSCVWPLPWFSSSQADHSNFHDDLQVSIVSNNNSNVDAGYYLAVYAILGVVFMIITLSREAVLFWGSLGASRRIHQRLVEAVMHAKFRFFDSTPLGQLMNRFSKDIESIDQEIAPVAIGVVHCLASIITVVVLISVLIPQFLIAAIFISVLFFLIGMFYINASRDLKRLESIQRSPLYQQFGETLSGMTTIRAYGDERRFIRENLNRVNTHNRPFIYLWAANRWLAFRVDVVGSMVSFFSGVFVVLSIGKLDAGSAGLAMTYAVTFTDNVLWFVRLYAANEQNMNSVERIKEYLDVEQEAPPIVEDNRPPANWPSRGSVEFIGYSTRYRKDFDYVLKGITFKILPGEKVGVVGRTGAGKSSLALALFRALEAEEGKILVDDVDIGMIGLQDLRENIVMVPQDPTLFSGTIRSNLDPFGLFTDEEIFTALRRVQLVGSAAPSAQTTRPPSPVGSSNGVRSKKNGPNDKKDQLRSAVAAVKSATANGTSDVSTPGTPSSEMLENKNIFRNLDSTVSESGSNLSQGQRQLLCLARALLKAPKVLLMDEATASIDYATDSKIQETIREIRNTTITIAHRLQTIVDYDKVLVLDKGEVIEFGDPWELMQQKKGIFRGMCETSGDLDVLEREAKKASEGRRLVDGQSGQ